MKAPIAISHLSFRSSPYATSISKLARRIWIKAVPHFRCDSGAGRTLNLTYYTVATFYLATITSQSNTSSQYQSSTLMTAIIYNIYPSLYMNIILHIKYHAYTRSSNHHTHTPTCINLTQTRMTEHTCILFTAHGKISTASYTPPRRVRVPHILCGCFIIITS